MVELTNLRVGGIATDGVEEVELMEPLQVLREAGARVDVLAPQARQIQGFRKHDRGQRISVDRTLAEARPEEYDALLLPGGALNADQVRMEPDARDFVVRMSQEGKPLAAICHAPWLLISAGLVPGRTLTSYPSIQDDVRNAGGNWLDKEVVVDGNGVTSRHPGDLPAFNREMVNLFASGRQVAESDPLLRSFTRPHT